jgi:DNA-binding transcriptional LysR family regulator
LNPRPHAGKTPRIAQPKREPPIDTLSNITAFVRVARLGSFSAAARQLGLVPSVVTKRIGQLEQSLGTKLLVRSTRGLTLTAAGERYLPRFVRFVAELEEMFAPPATNDDEPIAGHLRIKVPTTVSSTYIGDLLAQFLSAHPGVTLEIVLIDRSVNPMEEGFDFSIGALPVSYPNVTEVPLAPYEQLVCCAPSYLETTTPPQTPADLAFHDVLTSAVYSRTWSFEGPNGPITTQVHPRVLASDSRTLRSAALRGLGIAVLPRDIVQEDLNAGTLVQLLPNFPVHRLWLKALVPSTKMHNALVRETLAFLKAHMPTPTA